MRKILWGLSLILLTGRLAAQELEQTDSLWLKEVVLTYLAEDKTPVSFQNVGSADLKLKSTGQEPSFLLAETPSITNYSDAGSSQGYSYFRLRGIDQTRINLTLDGVPLNEPEDQGAYFSNYPDLFNSVSKIQIQRGVGTSQNGVASYGGSIQLFSPKLYDSCHTTIGFGMGSFYALRGFVEHHTGLRNGKALYVRASEIYSNGYKYHSGNHSQSVFVSGGWFRNKSTWKLNLLAGHQQNELAWLGVSDSLIRIDRRTNANQNERDCFFQSLSQIQHQVQLSHRASLQSSLYYTFLTGNYDFNLNAFLGQPSTDELYNYAFRSHLVGFFSNYDLQLKRLHIRGGLHGNVYARRHLGSEKSLGELYWNTGNKQEISLFAKADYSIRRLSLFADLQYRYVAFQYSGNVKMRALDWQFFNPKAGLSLQVRQNQVLYYSIGKTSREPTRNDMFGGNDELLADSLGNPLLFILKPESVIDQELGFRRQSQRWGWACNLYYMRFYNEIVLNGKFGPNGIALTNKVQNSFRTGIELSISYKASSRLSFTNHSSLNHSRITDQQETFSPILTPPLIVNQEVAYQWRRFSLALSGRYQAGAFIDFANSSKLQAYLLLNSRISYNLGGFELSAFLNNLTNAKYFNQAYIDWDGTKKYFVQAPFNFYLSAKHTF